MIPVEKPIPRRGTTFRAHLAAILVASLVTLAPVSVATWLQDDEQAEQRQVLVQIIVNTAYDDSESSLQQIATIISGLPQRRVPFRKNDNLSSLILREYRVSTYKTDSPTYLPKTYGLIEQAILAANKVTKPEEIRPGTILIPELPPKALEKFNPKNPLNSIPILSTIPFPLLAPKKNQEPKVSDFEFVGAPTVSDLGRPAAQNHAMDFLLTPVIAMRVAKESPWKNIPIQFFNYPMATTLAWNKTALGDTSIDHPVLTEPEHKYIRDLLSDSAQRDVLVFILDTGWPDPTEYAASRQTLNQIIRSAQQRFFGRNLGKPTSVQPFQEPSNAHCKDVNRSLAEFRALDPSGHIKIVYVPLTKEQNAAPLLTDLLQTEYLRNLTSHSDKQVKPNKELVKQSREKAENTVRNSYPQKWTGNEVLTDKSVLDAILDLANSYAEQNHTVFFVNESWTVPHDEYRVYYPNPLNGIVLAAAGNANQNVVSALLDFADRSPDHKDTLAVMNLRVGQSNFLCNSSFVGVNLLDQAMATAFDGEVDSSVCGTSFAAPRIAWILAADEVVRKSNFDSTTTWDAALDARLKKIRDPNASGFAQYLFDPIAFLKSSAP